MSGFSRQPNESGSTIPPAVPAATAGEPLKDPKSGQFVPGGSSRGRKKGARNRLHADFIVALQEHFQEVGHEAIEIAFRESPIDYLKIITAVLPKEFILEDGRLETMGDEEIAEYLDEIRRLKSGPDRSDAGGGAEASQERKQAPLLLTVSKAEDVPR